MLEEDMRTILVIDDDKGVAESIQFLLESAGYRIKTDLTGQILHHLKPPYPDLILMDIMLSGNDGRQLCSRLKSTPQTAHIPIVLMSALLNGDLQAKACGANGFLAKPFNGETLLQTIRVAVKPD